MRYLLHFVFGLLCGASAFAQTENSAIFILPNVEADSNTEVCLPITTTNFSSGVEFGFALQWTSPQDDGALTFSRIDLSTSSLPNIDMGDFNLTDYVAAGLITVQWGNYENNETCAQRDGTVTLDDGDILFEACFNVTGPIATNHPVNFFNLPDDPLTTEDEAVDIVFNKPPQCLTDNDAFPGIRSGSVTIGVKTLMVLRVVIGMMAMVVVVMAMILILIRVALVQRVDVGTLLSSLPCLIQLGGVSLSAWNSREQLILRMSRTSS